MSEQVGSESSLQQLTTESFLGVVDSDTPQFLYYFPDKMIMAVVPMTVCILQSQIIAFNIPLRLPSHAAKVGTHLARALKDSQVAQRKEIWSGAPRTCTCNMVVTPDVAREEHSFRHQRVFLRTFSTSVNSSMVRMVFLRNSVHWQWQLFFRTSCFSMLSLLSKHSWNDMTWIEPWFTSQHQRFGFYNWRLWFEIQLLVRRSDRHTYSILTT